LYDGPVKKTPSHRPFLYFLAFYAILAALIHADFGMTWDESDVYVRGWRLQKAFATGQPGLLVEKNEDPDGNLIYNHSYGLVQSLLNPSMDIDRYHAVNLVTASLAYASAYYLAFRATGNPTVALAAPIAVMLNPRFFGDTAANPKDAPYAVFYITFLASLLLPLGRRFWLRTILSGALLFLALSQRMAGWSLLPLWALWSLVLAPKIDKSAPVRWTQSAAISTAIALGGLYATWPYLRLSPLKNFWEILTLSAKYPYNGEVLFMGRGIPVHELPWTYPWVWLGIGVPLGILTLAAASFYFLRPYSKNPVFSLLGGTLVLNLVMVAAFRPSVYDGLRHLLFLLPLLSTLAVLGAWGLWNRLSPGLPRKVLAFTLACYGASLAFTLADLHPYEYLFFNDSVGGLKGAYGKYETDYWGASYREAAEWLRANAWNKPSDMVKIHTRGQALQSLAFLADRRVSWTELEDADYFLSFTRWNEHLMAGDRVPIHVVERDGVPLCFIYKMR
jgi:hypothetical protein